MNAYETYMKAKSIFDHESATVDMLLCLKAFAEQCGDEVVTRWISYELNGYPLNVNVPSYRKLPISIRGILRGYGKTSNIEQELPTNVVNNRYPDVGTQSFYVKSIREIESILRGGISDWIELEKLEGREKFDPMTLFASYEVIAPRVVCTRQSFLMMESLIAEESRKKFEQLCSNHPNQTRKPISSCLYSTICTVASFVYKHWVLFGLLAIVAAGLLGVRMPREWMTKNMEETLPKPILDLVFEDKMKTNVVHSMNTNTIQTQQFNQKSMAITNRPEAKNDH